MNLSRLKFKHLSNEELIAELECSAFADGQLDGDTSNDTIDYRSELEQRLIDKDIEILRLRREADKVSGLRMGEIQ